MLIERIYQTGVVPPASRARLEQVERVIEGRLSHQLQRPLRWMAVCSRAVSAGYRVAERRKAQRTSHLRALNLVRQALGKPDVSINIEGNLVYGYGAVQSRGAEVPGLVMAFHRDEQSSLFNAMYPTNRCECPTHGSGEFGACRVCGSNYAYPN